MRIAHHYNNGQVECTLVDGDGNLRSLEVCETLAALPAPQRFAALLEMDGEQRDAVNDLVLARGRVVAEQPTRLAPAVPDPPLYIYLHGNAPTIYKRQASAARQWELSRCPHVRVRPWASLAGHGAHAYIDAEARGHSCDTEFGVVIGRTAANVSVENAADHIAGVVALNDGFINGMHGEFDTNDYTAGNYGNKAVNTVHMQAMHTLYKAVDNVNAVGPWIITVEQLERAFIERCGPSRLKDMRASMGKFAPLYDLLTYNLQDGRRTDRSHTGAYLLDAEFCIAYFSRFMTLKPGTIIGLGSAGWDGQHVPLDEKPGSTCVLGFQLEDDMPMQVTVERGGPHAERTQSPLLERLSDAPPPTTRAAWFCRGNYQGATETGEGVGLAPFLMPDQTLGRDDSPIVIPPHATTLEFSVELAAVIGDEPVYNFSSEDAVDLFAGFSVMLRVWDASLAEHLPDGKDYEVRAAWLLGQFGDGFARLSQPVRVDDVTNRAMRINNVKSTAADYTYGLAHMLRVVSRTGTLLPGDVLSLGRTRGALTVAADETIDRVTAAIDGIGEIAFDIDDRRDPEAQRESADILWQK